MRVAIIDDDQLVREGLARILMSLGLESILVPDTVDEAIAAIESGRPDVVLVDVMLRGSARGVDLIERLVRIADGCPPIIAISSHRPGHLSRAAERAGADGYLTKDTDPSTLLEALRIVTAGGQSFAPIEGEDPRSPSPREIDVLRALADGLTADEAALRFGIQGSSVESYIAHMHRRYGVSNRAELLLLAARMGWIVVLPTGGRPTPAW